MTSTQSSHSGSSVGALECDNPDADPADRCVAAVAANAAAAGVGAMDATSAPLRPTPTPLTLDPTPLAHKLATTNEAVTEGKNKKKAAVPQAEIIGDEPRHVVLDPLDPAFNRIRHVTILDVDRNWTIEALHSHELKSKAEGDEATPVTVYPHDADTVLLSMDPTLTVETVYLRPDVRQSLAAIRRRKHTTDVFVNLYDRADETGVKIVEYMAEQGLAFTGAGARFYDPTRVELKRLCRYNSIPTPAFAIIADARRCTPELTEQLGGFPLFVKPEHGYDSVGIDEHSLILTQGELLARVSKIIDEFGAALVEKYVDGPEYSVLVAGAAKGVIEVFPPVEYRFPKERAGLLVDWQTGGEAAATATTTTTTSDPLRIDAATVVQLTDASAVSTPSPSDGSNSCCSGMSTPPPSASPALSVSSIGGAVDGVSAPSLPSSGAPASLASASAAAAPPPAAFICFEDKWGDNFENRWFLVDDEPGAKDGESTLNASLKDLALKLYEAFEGQGLARFDIRMNIATGQLMVLDVNPNCSQFYKDECTADTIMRLTPQWSKERFMRFLIDHALERQRRFHAAHAFTVKYNEEKGFSLHAARALREGDVVYTDEEQPLRLITRSHAQKTWTAKEMRSFDAYAWPVGEGVFAIWDEDSKRWKPINHSCDPSCWMDGLAVIARRPIARDEELTLDYATFEPSHPGFDCWCGADLCRREVRPNEYREAWFQERYGRMVSPHIRSLQAREKAEAEAATRLQTEATPACAQTSS